jgi:hypothetical protein
MNNPMNGSNSGLEERFLAVNRRICLAEQKWHRPVGSVNLVGASKKQSAGKIAELAALGLKAVGENYVQEAVAKQDQLDALEIEWHFIGSIQSNKTRTLAERFDWIHGVDRVKIARRLGNQRPAGTTPINICLQVNPDEEVSKAGRSLRCLAELADAVSGLDGIRLRGLMAIPAPRKNFDEQRRSFAAIRAALDSLNKELGLQMDCLSMGMSADLEAAIAEGATHVRIGTDLFGPRPPPDPD